MKKPNTFIVGKPKSGTSALHFFLEKHPEVFMCNPKEPRYFCSDFIKQSNDHYGKRDPYFYFQTQEEYLKLFEDAKDEKIVGEGSVIYMYSKESAQRIYDFNKDAKIIIMIREPVDFLYALHSEIVVTGKENEEDFKAALSLEDERKSGKNLPKRVRFPGMVYYSERMRIADQLQRFYDVFPKDQIKVFLFDEFKKDNAKIYKETLEFLEVDPSFKPEFTKVNTAATVRFKILKKIIEHPIVWTVPKMFFSRKRWYKLRSAFYNQFYKLVLKKAKRIPMDPDLKQQLMKKYKPEVEKLGKILDMDLVTYWGYDSIE